MILLKGMPVQKCQGCGKKRAWKPHTLCLECLTNVYVKMPYIEANTKHIGLQKRRSFSIEFEVGNTTDDMVKLIQCGYIATHDSSIGRRGTEWKSPIYHSIGYFARHTEILDRFAPYVTDKCGTHIHVGVKNYEAFVTYHSVAELILLPLVRRMEANVSETINVWGRYFNKYARKGGYYTHYGWVSFYTRSATTIEWRLPRYIHRYQFVPLVRFVLNATEVIEDVVDLYSRGEPYRDVLLDGIEQVLSSYQKLVKEVTQSCAGLR